MALFALILVACRSTVQDDAGALAARGAAAGERLAAYYDALASDTVDAWELTAFRRGFLKLPAAEADTRREFERQHAAMRSRARLARRLSNVYEAYGRSASYDAGSAINRAIHDLDEELEGVTIDGTTGDALDGLVAALARWKHDRDLTRGAALLGEIAMAVNDLFRAERELYRDIARDRAEKYRQVAIELVEAKEVVSTSLVNRVLGSYELTWPDSKEPFEDERTISGIKEIIEARARTFQARAESDTEGVGRALAALVAAHQ